MKRLLIGGLAVGSLLFVASGVASANTTSPLAAPTAISLSKASGNTVTGGSWPLATDPGSVSVAFATPSSGQAISGYVVTCKPPTKDTHGVLITPALPKLVATFAVNPADGTSTDADYANDGTTTTLLVGPYSTVAANELPPLACTVLATNAGGISKPSAANLPTPPAPSGQCSDSNATAASGLEVQLGSGNLGPVTGVNNVAPTPPSPLTGGIQHSQQNSFVVADLTAFGIGPNIPFCTTNSTYAPHLLSDQATTFAPNLSYVPAVTTPATKAHAPEAKFTGLGVVAPVKSSATLTLAAGSSVVYAYDAAHFQLDSCPSTAIVSCIGVHSASPGVDAATQASIISGSGGKLPSIPGVYYMVVVDGAGHTVNPGASIVSAKVTPSFSKLAGAPAALGILFAGSSLSIQVGTAPAVPVAVAPPGSVISQINASFVSIGSPACASPTTGPATATCLPYSALSGHANPYFGGDTNYTTPVAAALSSLIV